MDDYRVIQQIEQMENIMNNDATIPSDTLNFRIMQGLREELTLLGMSPRDRDSFVARAVIDVEVELSEEYSTRLINVARFAVRKFYKVFNEDDYDDYTIALMGSQFRFEFSE